MKEKLLYGLIGFPLDHSRSAAYFNDKFRSAGDYHKEYRLFPLKDIREFPGLLRSHPELVGLNVTIPYKELVIPFLTHLDETARAIGAVNAIRIDREGSTIVTTGFNTDAPGFLKSLTPEMPAGPALILGTGGASRAVSYALNLRNTNFLLVSRNRTGSGIISYTDLSVPVISGHKLIINTTPLGMYPETGGFPPIPYHSLTPDHFLYDLVYNPEETEFLKKGKAMNARTMNGMEMLINQAELSARIFPGML
jgi:shikimate dehydrogenase